jgi:hypothetical protein
MPLTRIVYFAKLAAVPKALTFRTYAVEEHFLGSAYS